MLYDMMCSHIQTTVFMTTHERLSWVNNHGEISNGFKSFRMMAFCESLFALILTYDVIRIIVVVHINIY